MNLSSPKPFRRPRLRITLRALPLVLLNGALVQVAHAQASGTPVAQPSALYSLLQTLSVFAFLALLLGAVRPKTFGFLFKEKATRGRVCSTFGAAWLFLVILSGPLRPRPVATAPTQNASQNASGKAQSAVRLAENRAKAAEARAEKAEKAAAVASANAKSKENASAKRQEALRRQVNKDLGIPESLSQPQAVPKREKLASNVAELDIPGVGKRQLGEVNDVVYMVVQMEKVQSVGGEYFNKQADGVFYVLRMRAFNRAKMTLSIRTRQMKLVDDQEREFDSSSEAETALNVEEKKSVWSSQLQPGVTRDFNLVYDAPSDAKGLRLKIPAGGFGFGKSATLKVPRPSE